MWDPAATAAGARKTKDATPSAKNSTGAFNDAGAGLPDMLPMDNERGTSAFGSAILTCTVVFPDIVGGRLTKGLGDHGVNETEDDGDDEEHG